MAENKAPAAGLPESKRHSRIPALCERALDKQARTRFIGAAMTKQQHKALLKTIKAYTRNNSGTAGKARSTLIKEGIYTKSGKLSKKYGGETKAASK
jgi:hypothetical protein